MFQLCSACQRHIKSATCPFCGSTEVEPVAGTPRGIGRISRGQLLTAVAVAGALAVSACGDEASKFQEGPGEDDVGGSTGGAPIYGAPAPLDDAGPDGSSSGDVPDAASADAGEPTDASGESDADVPDAT